MFGLVIFLFGVALAYFTANYVSTNHIFDYWGAVAIFAGAYVLIGIAISMVFPVSLGFLFAADILILHLLFQYYGKWASELKLFTIGTILVVLYISAWFAFGDKQEMPAVPPAGTLPS